MHECSNIIGKANQHFCLHDYYIEFDYNHLPSLCQRHTGSETRPAGGDGCSGCCFCPGLGTGVHGNFVYLVYMQNYYMSRPWRAYNSKPVMPSKQHHIECISNSKTCMLWGLMRCRRMWRWLRKGMRIPWVMIRSCFTLNQTGRCGIFQVGDCFASSGTCFLFKAFVLCVCTPSTSMGRLPRLQVDTAPSASLTPNQDTGTPKTYKVLWLQLIFPWMHVHFTTANWLDWDLYSAMTLSLGLYWACSSPCFSEAGESNAMKCLRRLVQPRADGSFLVPEEIIGKFKDIAGGGRSEVLRLYEQCGCNKDPRSSWKETHVVLIFIRYVPTVFPKGLLISHPQPSLQGCFREDLPSQDRANQWRGLVCGGWVHGWGWHGGWGIQRESWHYRYVSPVEPCHSMGTPHED